MMDPLFVLGIGCVAPDEGAEQATVSPSLAGTSARSDEAPGEPRKLDLSLLERNLRRGLSDVTRLFMHAARLALTDAALAPERAHVVFASAFGEIATADALLGAAYDANASSPARFRHSVHNTAAGLLSISTKSRLPSTALAAGWDTVAMGLCEASVQLASAQAREPNESETRGSARDRDDPEHVLLVFAEERVPFSLSAEHTYDPLGVAFVLGRRDGERAGRVRGRLSRLRRLSRDAGPRERASATRFDHPLAPALHLARALASGRSQTLIVGEGDCPWCIDVDAGEP